MEVWWVGADGSVQGAWWIEGAPWQRYPLVAVPVSAALSSGVAALSRGPSHMEVWWVGADGSVQGAWWTEGAAWQRYPLVAVPVSAALSSGVAALSRGPSHMEVWWVGADGSVQGAWWTQGAPWQRYPLVAVPVSAALSSGVAALSRCPTHMEVWWVGADGSVQGAWWTQGAPWQRYPLVAAANSAAPSSGVAALSRDLSHMEVWWVGADGSVQGAFFRNEPTIPIQRGGALMSTEVFRFVTIRPPQEPADGDESLNIIDLQLSDNAFFEKLRELRLSSTREAMQDAVMSFETTPHFIGSPKQVDQKVLDFTAAVRCLPNEKFWAGSAQAFAQIFGTTPGKFVNTDAFTAAFADVASSIVAAAIDASVKPHVRGLLVRTVRVLWLKDRRFPASSGSNMLR
jgi:hypothetical protein